MGLLRKVFAIVLALGVVVAGGGYWAYNTGAVGKPSVGVKDRGDWGEVSEQETKITTTLWVNNPNPVGVNIGESANANYKVTLNGVRLAEGTKRGVSIQSGNNSVEVTTALKNDKIAPWWVNFIQNNETIQVHGVGEVQINVPLLSSSYQTPPIEKTMLENRTPIIDAISNAVEHAEGRYTKTETVDAGVTQEEVTVGWVVEDAYATWGEVNKAQTEVRIHLRVHNPSERFAAPAFPDGLGLGVKMNDVQLFKAQSDALSSESISEDAIIKPGETREFTLTVTMDNDKVDEWFTSHVRRDEHSTVETRFQLVFEVPKTGTTIRVPEQGGIAYKCELQTGILVDNQNTSTTCGRGGTVTAG